MVRTLGFLLAVCSYAAVAATVSIPIEGAISGALDAASDRVFVVTKNARLASVDLSTKKIGEEIKGIERAKLVAAQGGDVVALSESADGSHVILHRVEAKTGTLKESIELKDAFVPRGLHFLTEDRLLLFSDYRMRTHVVSLKEKRVLSTFQAITGLLYAAPGISVANGKAFLPGAYPGEIAIVDFTAATPAVLERKRVSDWIHDVKLVGKDLALTAGHLQGVSLVDLTATDGDRGKDKVFTKAKFAHLLVEGKTAFAVSVDKVEIVDLTKETVTTVALPKLGETQFGRSALPLGRDKQNRLVVLVEKSGLIALD